MTTAIDLAKDMRAQSIGCSFSQRKILEDLAHLVLELEVHGACPVSP